MICVDEANQDEDEESEDGEDDDDIENDEEEAQDYAEDGRPDPPEEQLLKPYYFKSDSVTGARPKKQGAIARAAEKRQSPDLTSAQLNSMQIQLPVLESTKKGKLNLPISKEE